MFYDNKIYHMNKLKILEKSHVTYHFNLHVPLLLQNEYKIILTCLSSIGFVSKLMTTVTIKHIPNNIIPKWR
jgi:hypothetical protein